MSELTFTSQELLENIQRLSPRDQLQLAEQVLAGLVLRFRNSVMVFEFDLLVKWEAF
jgi:hypothetical protein